MNHSQSFSATIKYMYKKILAVVAVLFIFTESAQADFKAGGDAYLKGNYAEAAQHFEAAAERGDHRAMIVLGSMYAGGQGVEEDFRQAFKWFQNAAKYGRPDANYKLGLMYEQGLGPKQSFKKAVRYYGKAAKKGYPLAQYKLGAFYNEGLGVEHNPAKAYAWLAVANSKLEAALSEQTENDDASAELLAEQDEFKQNSAQQKLSDLRARLASLHAELTDEERSAAEKYIQQYSRY